MKAPSDSTKNPIGNHGPATWVFKEAFDNIMASVEAPERIKQQFCAEILKAHQTGSSREAENAAIKAFLNSGWTWHEYDKWKQIFQKRNIYPVQWHIYDIIKEPPNKPTKLYDALPYLKVTDMRTLLRVKGIHRKPAPKKREEFEAIISTEFLFEHLYPFVSAAFETKLQEYHTSIESGKCRLLAGTILRASFVSLRFHQCQDLIKTGFMSHKIIMSESNDCPITDEFAAKFNNGEISGIPPFFPGDRGTIFCVPQEIKK